METKAPCHEHDFDPGAIRVDGPAGPFQGNDPAQNLVRPDGSIGSFQGISPKEKRLSCVDIDDTVSNRAPSIPVKDDISLPDG